MRMSNTDRFIGCLLFMFGFAFVPEALARKDAIGFGFLSLLALVLFMLTKPPQTP